MAVGLSTTAANNQLDELMNAVDGYRFVQLHTDDPGAAGTANVATENTRMEATFAAATGGSKSTSADLEWLDVPAAEDFSHFSMWDALTTGNFGFSGIITANEVGIGDDFMINTGDLTASFDLAA